MKYMFPNLSLFFSLVLLVPLAQASPPAWKIVPNESTITFSATQNDAPVTGKFNAFQGEIYFDRKQLDKSRVEITVDMNSVSASYEEVSMTLKKPEWFDVQVFPKAVFSADNFIQQVDNSYQTRATLKIRDKTVPIVLNFSLTTYSDTKALAKGKTSFKRTDFGVGQGEWAKTDVVKDEVEVDFILSAIK